MISELWPRASWLPVCAAQTIQRRSTSNVNSPIAHRRRSERAVGQLVFRELFKFGSCFDHRAQPTRVEEVNVPVGGQWRCFVIAGQPLGPVLLAGGGVVRSRNSII